MIRRRFLQRASLLPLLASAAMTVASCANPRAFRLARRSRVRPGDRDWPTAIHWSELDRQTGGRLIEVRSPWQACRDAPDAGFCSELFKELKNPYFIGDDVALTQTTGWVDAWTSQPSVYAVAAQNAHDVAVAVNFAREHDLRLVVKGGGHSYLGTSNAPDSLLVWTHAMNDITLHDAFVASGCAGSHAPVPAVTVGAGAIWMHVYDRVTTKAGRYVQGGGCVTVGVAGLVQGGGFGSYSKKFGTAAASLLEAEIVTADGVARIANPCMNPDLFWALKGGGGGTFGVVTRLTLRTHDLPEYFGFVSATIRASSDVAFRSLAGRFVDLYADALNDEHWGEIVSIRSGRRLDVQMTFQGLDKGKAEAIWQPFFQWVAGSSRDFAFTSEPAIRALPAVHRWDAAYIKPRAPTAMLSDDRPGAPDENVFWSANLAEAGHFVHAFESAWLPAALLGREREQLADALVAAARHSTVELHFQKGLAGGSIEAIAATKETSMNSAVLEAFVLAIIAREGPPAYPGIRGHEPDLAQGRRNANAVTRAMNELRKIAPDAGSYVAESSLFERDWQRAYWGSNYARLLRIKREYDPNGLFYVRHGVGSEDWSDDGFTQVAER